MHVKILPLSIMARKWQEELIDFIIIIILTRLQYKNPDLTPISQSGQFHFSVSVLNGDVTACE